MVASFSSPRPRYRHVADRGPQRTFQPSQNTTAPSRPSPPPPSPPSRTLRTEPIATMAALAPKQESLKIFEKLKSKPGNKVRTRRQLRIRDGCFWTSLADGPHPARCASTATRRTRRGPRSPLASTYASTARPTTAASASTSRLFARRTSIVSAAPRRRAMRPPPRPWCPIRTAADVSRMAMGPATGYEGRRQ